MQDALDHEEQKSSIHFGLKNEDTLSPKQELENRTAVMIWQSSSFICLHVFDSVHFNMFASC